MNKKTLWIVIAVLFVALIGLYANQKGLCFKDNQCPFSKEKPVVTENACCLNDSNNSAVNK